MPALNTRPPWFRARKYLHFDLPIGHKQASRIVKCPQAVAQHAFYPLISFEVVSKKIRKAADNKQLETRKKNRPIAYASHVDAQIYSYYARLLDKRYEEFLASAELGQDVLAFRALGSSNIDFAARAFKEIASREESAAVGLDVTGFFDNLNHQLLKKQWADLLGQGVLPSDHYAVFRSLTKFSVVKRNVLFQKLGISVHNPKRSRQRVCTPSEFRNTVRNSGLIEVNDKPFGIPQGTPISAVLSNVYMMKFDVAMHRYAKQVGGRYFRYCDDILLIVPISQRDKCAGIASENIQKIKLKINTGKTELRTFRRLSGLTVNG